MSDELITSDGLNTKDQTTLSVLLSALLPGSEKLGVPPGNNAAVLEDIQATIRISALEMISDGLDELRKLALEQLAREFDSLSNPLRVQLFELMRSTNGAFYGTLSSVIVQCYYRNDQVMESLGMEPRPPYPKGHEVPQGDFNLLDPVRARGKIWRDV